MTNRITLNKEPLVSIIMPAFNSQDFIKQSIQSVLNQTYTNWELLIVDDKSTDTTVEIIKECKDDRIKLMQLTRNSGAAIARNTGIKKARGSFIAFLDSDDLWHPEKLTKQINFMLINNYNFTSTQYGNINEDGKLIDLTANHDQLDYDGILKYCPGNSTVIYKAEELGKFYIPDIKKRNDFVMWLQVIKDAGTLYGLKETLTYYRVRENSLSIDKKSLVKYQWKVYRNIEGLSLIKSFYLLFHKVIQIKFKLNKVKRNS